MGYNYTIVFTHPEDVALLLEDFKGGYMASQNFQKYKEYQRPYITPELEKLAPSIKIRPN